MPYFTAVLARDGDKWFTTRRRRRGLEPRRSLSRCERARSQRREPVLVLVEREDAWWAVVRVDGDEDPRVVRVGRRGRRGRIAYRRVSPGDRGRRGRGPRPRQACGGRRRSWPTSDVAGDLIEMCEDEMLPMDALAAVAEAGGFAEVLDSPRLTGRDDGRYAGWMRLALDRGLAAEATGDDVPVGAVVRRASGAVVAAAGTTCARPTATRPRTPRCSRCGGPPQAVGEWRLTGCTLVVTLEPCTMCAGALVLARVDRLVFGAEDPKAGAVGSLWDVVRDRRLNHRPEVVAGVLAAECARAAARVLRPASPMRERRRLLR